MSKLVTSTLARPQSGTSASCATAGAPASRLGRWTPFGVVLIVSVVNALPLVLVAYPPFQDFGAHVQLLDAVARRDDPATPYYATHFTAFSAFPPRPGTLPYVLADVLSPVCDGRQTAFLLLFLYGAGLPLALYAVGRSFGRSGWLALLGCPLVYNRLLDVGLLPFLLGIPLILTSVAAAQQLGRRQEASWRWGGLLAASLALLYLAHGIAFVAGSGLVLLVLAVWWRRPRDFVKFLPSVGTLVPFVLWADGFLSNTGAARHAHFFPSLLRSLKSFYGWSMDMFRGPLDEIASCVLLAVWVALIVLSRVRRDEAAPLFPGSLRETAQGAAGAGNAPSSRILAVGRTAILMCRHHLLELLTVVTLSAYFALPRDMGYIKIVGARLPVLVLCLLVLWPRPSRLGGWRRTAAVAGAVAAVLAYAQLVHAELRRFESTVIGRLPQVLRTLPSPVVIGFDVGDSEIFQGVTRSSIWHAPKLPAARYDLGVVGDSFAGLQHTPLGLTSLAPSSDSRPKVTLPWSLGPYDVVVSRGVEPRIAAGALHQAVPYWSGDGWHVFLVRHAVPLAWRTPPALYAGGTGGHRHTWRCPEGLVLTGVDEATDGRSVLAMQPSCGAVERGDSASVVGPVFENAPAKSSRHAARCPPGTAVVGLEGRLERWLAALVVVCGAPGEIARESLVAPPGGPGGRPFRLRCPRGEWAVGLGGRFGEFIDGVELACEPVQGRDASGAAPRRGNP
ncbi:MAG: hypothetical protein HY907_22530 [Deltaproteobacteria bacterium]|nr:hypothetical protein [Deltaproteobacteria bacterium]